MPESHSLAALTLAYSFSHPFLKYSILNPETNLDSPRIKSIGFRLNSVKILTKNIKNKRYKTTIYTHCQSLTFTFVNVFKIYNCKRERV